MSNQEILRSVPSSAPSSDTEMLPGSCRFCGSTLQHTFVDLGISPLANSYLKPAQLDQLEPLYPLCVYVCGHCFLVQLQESESPEHIFKDYAYFSSYSESWLENMQVYTDMIVNRLGLNEQSQVVEIGSNDGYLLQYFVEKAIPVLGIEPAANVAEVAITKGIPTVVEFFAQETASELASQSRKADLLIGNNVLAHVPELNDFVKGMKILLKPTGVITMEFPYLQRLMAENQFDTIYHEHFSYFSFITIDKIFSTHGLKVFDVDEIPTHGGSLRIYACHSEDASKTIEERVTDLISKERRAGLAGLDYYLSFPEKVRETKSKLLDFLITAKNDGKFIAGYGAPAKGNTLLNYCGIGSDLVDYTVDRSPHKQGHFLPGTHIPIYEPDRLKRTKPDYVLLLAWNLREEIMKQIRYVRDWEGKFVIPIPEVKVFS